ncbi:hypothetical protein KBX37_23010 [Micromonospora sp. U56]|uniref:hypothetical protein n=1 Tax=Micromonospora sp. U56 TaxID=2824900 RepID=UPI001B3651E3|nr:hypothetical protein [Micromonospora sp. U56]MBQ0895930.1 hypothetical protein [Micromonospora sp. U56]
MHRWTTTLALLLVLTGCAGERTERQEQVPAWQSGTTAGPTAPALLGRAEAQQRYLRIVQPYNVALEKLEDATKAGKPWRTVRELAAEVATKNAAHAVGLRETSWPVTARAPMAALLAENDVALEHWRRAGRATGPEELMREIRAAAAHSGSREATAVRSALGLPAYRES